VSVEFDTAVKELIDAYPSLTRYLDAKDPARYALDRALNAWTVVDEMDGMAVRNDLDSSGGEVSPPSTVGEWLVDGADLLAEPDPGPTPWLIDGLVVDQALTAVVGKWKTTKSWGMLDMAVSIATGTDAFGAAAVAEPGPVVYVVEESGRRALWRRLDALCRGRAIQPEALRGKLLLAPNARVKLDDAGWQESLLELGAPAVLELLRSDATHLTSIATTAQAAAAQSVTEQALIGRTAMWEGSTEDNERIEREKREAVERYRQQWGRNPPGA